MTAVIVCGATGRTGNAVVHVLAADPEPGVRLAALVAPSVATTPTRPLPEGVPAFARLVDALDAAPGAVVVDLTHAAPAIDHAAAALAAGQPFVIGATGIDDAQLVELGEAFQVAELGLLVVPNFSLGAVLLMELAERAAEVFDHAEVVEAHHPHKRDAPSGTARRTAERVGAVLARRSVVAADGDEQAGEPLSRGERIDGVPVHALRVPGASAHQEVIFGGAGEFVTLRHDAVDRGCYARGVARAARGVGRLRGLHIGLEHVL